MHEMTKGCQDIPLASWNLLLSQDPRNFPGCREVALLEQELKMYPIIFLETCFFKYYCVCVLL